MRYGTATVPASLDPQGPAADDIAGLWWILLALGVVVFALVTVLLVLPIFRRRRGATSTADRGDVPPAVTRRWIVGLGVVLPAVLLTTVLVLSVSTMRSISRPAPRGSVVIEVVGYQYWWSARYRESGVTVANELHVPVGQPVELRLRSADVIHSFWVPALHGKLDLLPDHTNTLVIAASEPGVYGGECAEFCGVQHTKMSFLVIAQPQEEFDAWLAAQQRPAVDPAAEAARRGAEVFAAEGCAQCHVVAGVADGATSAGPDLTHVASRRTLASNTFANTTENLTRWLQEPDALKEGTTMPAPELSAQDVRDVVAYLEALE